LADEHEFKTMQQEAIRRVQEMQRRSKNYVGSPDSEQIGKVQNDVRNTEPAVKQEYGDSDESYHDKNKALFNIGGIKIDEEKALIALMIYILYKNKADMKLLLGLGYLLL
jgi:hypothetical protein